ncbi:thioredoxin domain-containing protein 5 homolog isoform X2 [Periplaneta americana]|uniref:thioredoxin domain-containing protein 5 homolog isoform X2 n=1 Tax=Periplaneta americana TaxID=6978 RepID=UPI0037E717F2
MWKIWLCFISCVALSSAHDNDIHTVQYTSDTFSTEVPKKNHFVMFFAPWCGHCNRLAPTWEQLAETFNKDEGSQVKIAKVDCTADTSLCSDHDVTGYPTLKFFKAGESEAVKFRGARDISSLTVFINEQLGNVQEEPAESKPKIPEPVNGLVELTEDTFSKHVEQGKHFVKFYAPWCGHCQKLSPTWDSLAKALEHDTTVTIAKVDCTVHKTVCNTFDIKGYPTLLWIEDGKKAKKYQGQRTQDGLKAFVAEKLGASEPAADEESGSEPGPVVSYSGENFDHGIAKGIAFTKFFAPWCGHCKRLAPIWEELGKKFIGNPFVKIAKVDCTLDMNKELCSEQEVDGFPSLYLYKDGSKVAEYTGSRNLDDLYEFVAKHLPHDEL